MGLRASTFLLLIAALTLAAGPMGERAHVTCADGSSCAAARSAARPCCAPRDCAGHSTPGRCVVRVTAPVHRVVPDPVRKVPPPQLLARLAAPQPIVRPSLAVATYRSDDEDPPDRPSPDQGCTPRGPPAVGVLAIA